MLTIELLLTDREIPLAESSKTNSSFIVDQKVLLYFLYCSTYSSPLKAHLFSELALVALPPSFLVNHSRLSTAYYPAFWNCSDSTSILRVESLGVAEINQDWAIRYWQLQLAVQKTFFYSC